MAGSSYVALALTIMAPILINAASIPTGGGGQGQHQHSPGGDFFSSFLGGNSEDFLGDGAHSHGNNVNAVSSDVVCRAFLSKMEALRRSDAMTCKNFLDPKLIPEDVRAFCKFSGIEALKGCQFGPRCINNVLRATAVSPSLGACVCHSFTEAFLSLYSQAYLFCDENGGSRQERLFKIPDKIFEIGFASLTGKNGIGFATGFFLGKPEAGGLGLSAFEGSGDDEGGDD